MFESLLRSAVALVTTPVALATDVLVVIPDAVDEKKPFRRTSDMLDKVGDNFKKAVDPNE